jgi:hypothetical protein
MRLKQKRQTLLASVHRAELRYLCFDTVSDFSDGFQLFLRCACKNAWVGKSPVQTFGDAWKNGTALGAGFVADGDNPGKELAGFEKIKNAFGLVSGDVNADFLHRLDDKGVERSRFQPGAFRLEAVAAEVIHQRLGHLAAGTVVNAYKKNFFFAHSFPPLKLFSDHRRTPPRDKSLFMVEI